MEKNLALFIDSFNPEISVDTANKIIDEEILLIKDDVAKYDVDNNSIEIIKRLKTFLARDINHWCGDSDTFAICLPDVVEVNNTSDESRDYLKNIIIRNSVVKNTSFIYVVSATNHVGDLQQGHWFVVVQSGFIVVVDSDAGDSFADLLCDTYVFNTQNKLKILKTSKKT